jgi:hypothetical protein
LTARRKATLHTYMALPHFSLSVEFDSKPLSRSDLRRFSLVLKSGERHELVIKGFLLPEDHREILSPTTLVRGQRYSIASLSPALQEAILNSFSYEDLFTVKAAQGEPS